MPRLSPALEGIGRATGLIVRGWQARLYPTKEQAIRLNQWAGALRFLSYGEEPPEPRHRGATRVKIGDQELAPVPVDETRILATAVA